VRSRSENSEGEWGSGCESQESGGKWGRGEEGCSGRKEKVCGGCWKVEGGGCVWGGALRTKLVGWKTRRGAPSGGEHSGGRANKISGK